MQLILNNEKVIIDHYENSSVLVTCDNKDILKESLVQTLNAILIQTPNSKLSLVATSKFNMLLDTIKGQFGGEILDNHLVSDYFGGDNYSKLLKNLTSKQSFMLDHYSRAFGVEINNWEKLNRLQKDRNLPESPVSVIFTLGVAGEIGEDLSTLITTAKDSKKLGILIISMEHLDLKDQKLKEGYVDAFSSHFNIKARYELEGLKGNE